jgi:hypothetical protein
MQNIVTKYKEMLNKFIECILWTIHHLKLPTYISSSQENYYCPHYTDTETEAQRILRDLLKITVSGRILTLSPESMFF